MVMWQERNVADQHDADWSARSWDCADLEFFSSKTQPKLLEISCLIEQKTGQPGDV